MCSVISVTLTRILLFMYFITETESSNTVRLVMLEASVLSCNWNLIQCMVCSNSYSDFYQRFLCISQQCLLTKKCVWYVFPFLLDTRNSKEASKHFSLSLVPFCKVQYWVSHALKRCWEKNRGLLFVIWMVIYKRSCWLWWLNIIVS